MLEDLNLFNFNFAPTAAAIMKYVKSGFLITIVIIVSCRYIFYLA